MTEVVQAGERRSARVESLRAVGALAVLGSHVFAYAHGWRPVIFHGFLNRAIMGGGFGVQLFFALSGYLLYRAFARRDFGDGAPVNARTYARNRALRILPLYYAAVVSLLLFTQRGGSGEQWWRFLLFAEEFSTKTAQTVDAPLWSIVVEVHFYIVLPFLAWALARVSRRSAARGSAVLVAMGVASVALRHAALTPAVIWSYSFPVTFYGFVPGMLLALISVRWAGERPAWLSGVLASSDAWVLASVALWIVIFWRYSLVDLTAPASFLIVGACVLPLERPSLVRLLDWRPLALVGVVSYSLYVWHVPIIEHVLPHAPKGTLALLAIVLPLSLAVAAASYAVIERPFLVRRGRWSGDAPAELSAPLGDRTWMVLLGLTALSVRLAVVLQTRHLRLSSDPADYNRLGRLLAAGHGFGPSLLSPSGGPTTFRAPLYPKFLAVVYRVTGDSITAARCVQALLGVGVVALIGCIALLIWDRRVAWVAAGIASIFPALVITSTALMSEAIFVPLELAAVTAALMARTDPARRWRWLAASGASAGLGILARPNGAALVVGLVALVVVGVGRRRDQWLASLVVVGSCLVMVAPWIVRDAVVFKRLVPVTDIDGYNLAGVYNAQAAGSPYPAIYQWRAPVAVPALVPLFHDPSLNEVTLGDRLRDRGLSWIEAHPTSVGVAVWWNTWRMAELTGIGESAIAIDEAGLGRTAAWLEMLTWWAVAALAVLGFLRGARRRASGPARVRPWALWVAPIALWAITAPFLGTSRLRAPIDPFVVLAAAAGLVSLRPGAPPGGAVAEAVGARSGPN
jgi:peptidoglycan/LPS O-acetylase OafA/YrhL